ncbi:hypothetical protein FRB95_011621 [Tulasnella sp. JGI-2019a]|nr:hypothetical protein FRB95_011621 [Tulasnella sp. JGI-2019a]
MPAPHRRKAQFLSSVIRVQIILRAPEASVDFQEVVGNTARVAAFIGFASREAYRWRSIDFRIEYDKTLDLLRNSATLSVLLLETLSIGYMRPRRELSVDDRINMFGGRADRLRHVKLYDLVISLSSQLFSGLETLTIAGARVSPGPSTNEIVDVLRRCPELCAFELDYSGEEEIRTSDAIPSEAEEAHLPLLTSFNATLTNATALNRIISSIRVPACSEFTLACNDPTNHIFSNESTHFTTALFSTIHRLSRMWLKFDADGFSMDGQDDESDAGIDTLLVRGSPLENFALILEHGTKSGPWPPTYADISCKNSVPFLQEDILC